ncbi:MAG TPA: hypothetical protein VHW00_03990 [Thermoanaerobaculia bacterium]|nr:hypothetical protein [Thermoanaerobaculia bacterium]
MFLAALGRCSSATKKKSFLEHLVDVGRHDQAAGDVQKAAINP